MANNHQLSAEQIQSFLDDGYLIVSHLFDQEEADLYWLPPKQTR